MATPIVKIASLEIETDQVLKESARLKANIDSLKEANKSLQEAGKGSSVAFQRNAAELKTLSKQYNDNQKLAAALIDTSEDVASVMSTEGKSVQQLRNDRAKLQQIGKNITGDTKEEIEARNKLNKAIDAQTDIIKSDASPAYIKQAENIGNYVDVSGELNTIIQQGNNILNVAKGIYSGYGDQVKAATAQIRGAAAGTEGMTAAQRNATVATNLTSGAMKILKVAIASTGIGLLVIALASLVSYFSNTQKGADEASKVMKALGAIIDVLVDRVSAFGGALVKFFSGDFTGGFNDMKTALSGVGDELAREARLAYDLEAAFQAMEDREIGLIKTQAERKKNIEELRLLAKDEQKDINERVRLLQEAGDIEKAVLADELAIAKERARISAERLALGESSRDDIRENEQLQARVLELETQSLKQQRTIEAERQSLLKRSASEATAAARKRVQENIQAYNTELEIFKTVNAEKLSNNIETLEELKSRELEIIDQKVNGGLLKEREAVLERLKIENEFLESKAEIETAELERIQSFNERKKELERELKLQQITDERELEELRIQQEFEDHILELENLELRETEKTELLRLLEEQRRLALDEVDQEYTEQAIERRKQQTQEEAKLEEQRIKQQEARLDAIASIAGQETAIGQAALIAKQILAAKEQLIDLGLFTSKASLKLSETTVDIASGTAKSAAAAPFPANLPLIAGFVGTVAGIVGAIKKATNKGKKSLKPIPKAARGAFLNGPSHANGGIHIEAEGGEAIINKRSTAKYLPLLSAINQAGGGVPLAENGGIAGKMSGPSVGLIDYDLLAAKVAEANASLPTPSVSVEEFNRVASNVSVVENSKDF